MNIKKNIEPTIVQVLDLMTPASFTVKLAGHHLDLRIFELSKGKRQYDFKSTAPIPKGVQTHKEIQFDTDAIVELEKPGRSLFATGNYILVNHISYDLDNDVKCFSGSISSFATVHNKALFNEKFLRCVIPVGLKEPFQFSSFQISWFETPQKKLYRYIDITVSSETYHLFNYKFGDQNYIVIDCLHSTDLNSFQKKCFNILLTLGFIEGDLIHDECFIATYNNAEMEIPIDILYHSMRASVYSNQPTYTYNAFSVHHDIDFERDEKGFIKKEMTDKLNDGMFPFPKDVFSKLASQFFEKEKLQRAALLFIQSHVASLEMRIPNYYVAIEAITGHISKEVITGKKALNPIKDSKLAGELIKSLKELSMKVKTEKGLNDTDFDFTIFEKNLNKLNTPPNADKLTESFTHFSYTLTKEQKDILIERNTFLHGSFLKTLDDDAAFRGALHVGLRLHFMIAFLLLKLAGYSGKIINYAELWSHITGRKLGEERLVKI